MSGTNTSSREAGLKAYTLSQLTGSIEKHIQNTFKGSYWIKAEINKLNYYPQSGHCYPELVEKNEGRIIAQIRGFMARNTYEEVEINFKKHLGSSLGEGITVLMRCGVNFHSVYGMSLRILDIDPSFTLGEMARLRLEAIQNLKKAGLFEKNKGLYLPLLVKRLAIVSVETSKGLRDFSEVIENSPYRNLIQQSLFPAKLQGDQAVDSLSKALEKIRIRKERFDAVLIIRGGGGETGMDCYDHYGLAEKVCSFPLPVLTGIGHSTNLTVVEMVSHKNLITPTALAHFILEGYENFENRLEKAIRSLKITGRQYLPTLLNRLNGLADKTERKTLDRLDREKSEIRKLGRSLESTVQMKLDRHGKKLEFSLPLQLKTTTQTRLSKCASKTEFLQREVSASARTRVEDSIKTLDHYSEKLRLLDPVNVLKRGFSITMKNGKPVTSAGELNPGDQVKTVLAQGDFLSEIKNIDHG